jgi:ankyrin repeat protein
MERRIQAGKIRLNLCASILGGVALTGVALATFANVATTVVNQATQNARKTTEPPTASQGKLCNDLFLAIIHGDAKGLDGLLSNGADPNSRNGLQFTPIFIAAASHQSNLVDALLKAGAKFDATSNYGTPLTFASMSGNVPDAMRFLSMGANPDFLRNDGMSPLAMATNVGCTPIVDALIEKKVNVNTQDDGGYTALAVAARQGFASVGKKLIDAGAKVDLADVDGETPLMLASENGHADVVKMLLENGAKPNATDSAGKTALLLAASYGDYPEVANALLNGKANPKAKDAKGRTAAQIASARGFRGMVAVLGGTYNASAIQPKRTPRQAVNLSLKLIQSSTRTFEEGATCVSCHQEGLGRIATGEAQARGFHLDAGVQAAEAGRINGMVAALKPLHQAALKDQKAMMQLPLIEINEVTPMYSWILSGMAAQKQAPSEATGAMAMCLGRQQAPDGSWTFMLPRAPMQSSNFSFTAYAVDALNTYGPKTSAAEVEQRVGNARKWLLATKAATSEDRASKLLGLKYSGASINDRRSAAAEILKDQNPDGGWSQLPGTPSDAYATGQALYALRVGSGMSSNDSAYKRGTRYLLLTQDDDGSWYVNKRAIPANNYFDGGFPHGESQYASFNATCWATLALLPATAK